MLQADTLSAAARIKVSNRGHDCNANQHKRNGRFFRRKAVLFFPKDNRNGKNNKSDKQGTDRIDMSVKHARKNQNGENHSTDPAGSKLNQEEQSCFLFLPASGYQIVDRINKLVIKTQQESDGSAGYARHTVCQRHAKSSDKLH